jgi:hypothetical protein
VKRAMALLAAVVLTVTVTAGCGSGKPCKTPQASPRMAPAVYEKSGGTSGGSHSGGSKSGGSKSGGTKSGGSKTGGTTGVTGAVTGSNRCRT